MKKIADFLIKSRYVLLIIFIGLAIASIFMSKKTNINSDMSKYLPDSSQMKNGTTILKEEFTDLSEDCRLRVMFDNLKDEQKLEIKDELATLDYVDSVVYEPDSIHYNKDNHTLYLLSSKYDYSSKEFKQMRKAVMTKFSGYDIHCQNENQENDTLPGHIIAGAVIILMIILFIMSNSWVEPFLFITSIGLSILINMGTNMFLPSVSKTTHSIASILQLVLAMDYSIILSNRYRQERKKVHPEENSGSAVAGNAPSNDIEAMRNAIASAIPSVCSSSITTIVGLLALCFMNFKIGADLGIVLAKGVFFSLLCVFTVLPGLMTLFDKLIQKTAKKSPFIPMGGLAKAEYKARIIFGCLFLVIFGIVFVAKDKAGISYGNPSTKHVINDVFPKENRFIVLYDNNDESRMPEFIKEFTEDENVAAGNCFATTLGAKMNSQEMYQYIDNMLGGADSSNLLGGFTLDESIIKFIYYDRFSDREGEKMTLEEFVGFVNAFITNNPMASEFIDEASMTQLNQYSALCSKDAINTQRNADELSQLFGIDKSALSALMSYTGKSTLSINELLAAIKDPTVSTVISASGALTNEDINAIAFYDNLVSSIMNDKSYTAKEMATMIALIQDKANGESSTKVPKADETTEGYIRLVYEYYFSSVNYDDSWTMDIEELFNHIMESETFSQLLDEESKKGLQMVSMGLSAGKGKLVGKSHSICALTTYLIDGHPDSMEFTKKLESFCDDNFEKDYYLIGNTPMSYEMSKTFKDELNKITLITALAIFIVVLVTFRSLVIPTILVLLIQCSVYITMVVMNLFGMDMHYLALLIVQSLLMGATIDYAIVFTNFYIEKRADRGVKEALKSAYQASIRTILTSGLIMIFITWILGYVFADPSIGQICHIISIGVTCALVMILCFLPGMLAVCDRFVVKKTAYPSK